MTNDLAKTPSRWRAAPWAAAAGLLLVPLIAMRFTDEVRWDLADFAFAATMLAIAIGGWELATRMSGHAGYRAGAALALLAGFLLVWINLAVGIIGAEDEPLNLLFVAVLAVAGGGAIVVRGRAAGMARTMVAAAVVQAAVAGVALAAGADAMPLLGVTAMFGALWLGAGWLFGRAARG